MTEWGFVGEDVVGDAAWAKEWLLALGRVLRHTLEDVVLLQDTLRSTKQAFGVDDQIGGLALDVRVTHALHRHS